MLSHVGLFATPWTATHQASLSITKTWSLLKLMSIELQLPSNNLILCRPLLTRHQSFPASESFQMSQLFTSGGRSIEVSTPASLLPVNIQDWFVFRIDWFDLLVVQGILKSLLQNRSSKASVLWHSAFFMIQLSDTDTYYKYW